MDFPKSVVCSFSSLINIIPAAPHINDRVDVYYVYNSRQMCNVKVFSG